MVTMPAWSMLPVARLATAAQRLLPFHVPAEYEGVVVTGSATRCDDRRAREELGVAPRPLLETVRDTVHWLHQAGYLTSRQAGAAAA